MVDVLCCAGCCAVQAQTRASTRAAMSLCCASFHGHGLILHADVSSKEVQSIAWLAQLVPADGVGF